MTMLFCDSFAHYSTAQLTRKWTTVESGVTISAGTGRRGNNAMRLYSALSVATIGVPPISSIVVGFACKIDSLTNTAILTLTEAARSHLVMNVTSGGALVIYRSATQILTSAGGVITANNWHYIEIKATISDTVGKVEVRVDGVPVVYGTGSPSALDTQDGGTGLITAVTLNTGVNKYSWINDLYICDTSGTRCNNFLGDVRVDAYLPSGNGSASDFVGSDADSTDNYLLVDESSPDDATSYVESSTVGDEDVYAFPAMSHTPDDIFAVQVSAQVTKDVTGTRQIALLARSGGTTYPSAQRSTATSYLNRSAIWQADPAAASPNDWTTTSVAAAEFGVKVAA